jgi:hypothetical protein
LLFGGRRRDWAAAGARTRKGTGHRRQLGSDGLPTACDNAEAPRHHQSGDRGRAAYQRDHARMPSALPDIGIDEPMAGT